MKKKKKVINKVIAGDCSIILKKFPDNSIDSIVTDPPYGLSSHSTKEVEDCLKSWLDGKPYVVKNKTGFMGKTWDSWVPGPEIWKECFRVLKPGGYMLVFSGSRTIDLMNMSLRLSGFDIRDTLMWVYGSGFPKSLNIGKKVDEIQGNDREVIGIKKQIGAKFKTVQEQMDNGGFNDPSRNSFQIDKGTSEWEGWGTALKPSHEPICMARKPLSEKTIAENVLKWGVGGINIDGCRVGMEERYNQQAGFIRRGRTDEQVFSVVDTNKPDGDLMVYGRFPANLIHDGSDEVIRLFPNSGSGNNKGVYSYAGREYNNKATSMFNGDKPKAPSNFNDTGSASRFFKSCPYDKEDIDFIRLFYEPKASRKDRNDGCDGMPEMDRVNYGGFHSEQGLINNNRNPENRKLSQNNHPTVKPTKLLQYLIRLVTPKNGIVLDPFIGSGTTGKAAILEGFKFIGIEKDTQYVQIARARVNHIKAQKKKSSCLLKDL